MLQRRPKLHWRPEPGAGYDLRQYAGRRPTGLVAVTAWDRLDPSRRGVAGPDVRLFREGSRLVVEEHRPLWPGALVLQIPLGSCQDAGLAEEPGLPGTALLRLTLVVRVGRVATFTLPLWFAPPAHDFLQDLVEEIRECVRPAPPPPAVPVLPPLVVGQAPDHEDWVVFRPAADGVLAARPAARERA